MRQLYFFVILVEKSLVKLIFRMRVCTQSQQSKHHEAPAPLCKRGWHHVADGATSNVQGVVRGLALPWGHPSLGVGPGVLQSSLSGGISK